jgi:pilus retraction protein PilT
MDTKELFKMMVEKEASDIFFKVGYPPYIRRWGKVVPLESAAITAQNIQTMIKSVANPNQIEVFSRDKEVDFVVDFSEIGRFRGSLFLDRQAPAMVFRHVKRKIPAFAELGLPPKIMEKLSMESRGFVVVTGAVGNGKSTTLASMIEYINQQRNKHILTIEEPIEYIFENKSSVITQKELGMDTVSYSEALRHCVYQSPDVVYIGTIRDTQTMATAIDAAESGQLVLTTLHAINAPQAVERIVNFFPAYLHEEVKMRLSLFLKGVISQRLVPRIDGNGRIPACEIMVLTPTIASLIREGKTNELNQYIEGGAFFGMQSFHQSLARLYLDKKISLETAKEFSDNPKELDLFLQGIKKLDGVVE